MYCALIGYIHYEAPLEEQNFATLIEFLNAMEVREDDETFQNPVDQMFEALKKKKQNHFAVRQYAKFKLAAGMGDVALYTEMGRFFMLAPYGCLVTTEIHEKHTYKEYIGVDACAVNLMRPAMYGAYHHITVMGKENEPCDHKYDVTGSLCENNDKFAIDRMLPKID